MDQPSTKVKWGDAYKDTLAFFEFLIPGFNPSKTPLEFRAIFPGERGEAPGAKSMRVTGTLDYCHKRLSRLNEQGYGVFVTVNKTDGRGVKAENIVGYRAGWADWDHGRPKLVPSEPSLVIETSPGRYQAYWLLRDKMTEAQFKSVMKGIVTKYGGDNRCKDSARVLRVPGFDHTKGEPWRVRYEGGLPDEVTDYTASELVAAFGYSEEDQPRPTKKAIKSLFLTAMAFDPVIAKDALDFLPVEVADDYEGAGIKVCAALKRGSGGSEEGRELWHEFAARSRKYKPEWADEKWDSYDLDDDDPDKIHFGTLIHMAQQYGWKDPRSLAALPEVEVAADNLTASEFARSVAVWGKDEKSEFLSRMNREHAIVGFAASTRYLHERVGADGEKELVFLRPEDAKRWYANVSVPFGDSDRKLNGFDAWDRWPGRRQYNGVGLFPGDMQVPAGYLNLWQGFAVKPRRGKWSLFDDHLFDVVCAGNEAHYWWLRDWMAHLVQCPHEKPGSAVVLKSEVKGTGKSMVVEFLRRILGPHAMSVSHTEHVVGKFNGHFLRNILLGLEEAFWAGNKAAEGVIKNLITEPYITIEQKGVDPISARNYTRLMVTTNAHWSVPAGIDERRFFVLEVRNPNAKKRSYFDPIFEQMGSGGTEAMLFDLLNQEIKSNLRNPPETTALQEERLHSLDGVHRWVCDVAKGGAIFDKRNNVDVPLREKTETEVKRSVVQEAAKECCTLHEAKSLNVRLGKLLTSLGVETSHPTINRRRTRVYVFPPLAEFRAAVEQTVRVPVSEPA